MMDKLAIGQQNAVVISLDTKELIKAGVSDNTLKAYRHALKKLETWLGGRGLDDRLLAEYIAELHTAGRSPATIAQAVAAVKWRGLEDAVGEIALRSLAGIRREGMERGRGQVDGLTRVGMERVCSFAEAEQDLGWAEGCVNDSADERLSVAYLGGGCGQR